MSRNPRSPEIPFTAGFTGTCCECSNQFPVGAQIRKWGGQYAHAGCTKGRKQPVNPSPRTPGHSRTRRRETDMAPKTIKIVDVNTGEVHYQRKV